MKILKCQRRGINDIEFIDPYYIHEKTLSGSKQQAVDTENNLVEALRFNENKREILFPYNFE